MAKFRLAALGQGTRHSVVLPAQPRRGTRFASAPSFRELTRGQLIADSRAVYPFATAADKLKYGRYADSSQAAIATALRHGIAPGQSTGTAPELVLLGFYLMKPGWVLGRNLLFQSQGFDVFHRYKPFTVDIAVRGNGLIYYYPVDGARFHETTLFQIVRDMVRDARLRVQGEVIPVIDRECQSLERLALWLRAHGGPA